MDLTIFDNITQGQWIAEEGRVRSEQLLICVPLNNTEYPKSAKAWEHNKHAIAQLPALVAYCKELQAENQQAKELLKIAVGCPDIREIKEPYGEFSIINGQPIDLIIEVNNFLYGPAEHQNK